jgi:hypothetical protein
MMSACARCGPEHFSAPIIREAMNPAQLLALAFASFVLAVLIVWTACMIWQEYRPEIARLLSRRRASARR